MTEIFSNVATPEDKRNWVDPGELKCGDIFVFKSYSDILRLHIGDGKFVNLKAWASEQQKMPMSIPVCKVTDICMLAKLEELK